jgi:hypothetical protein
MNGSHFSFGIDGDSVSSFDLSLLASEWIFSIKFWRTINNKIGTILDQYEEDCIRAEILPNILEEIDSVIHDVNIDSREMIDFSQSWDANIMPIVKEIDKNTLLEELMACAVFFRRHLSTANQSFVLSKFSCPTVR